MAVITRIGTVEYVEESTFDNFPTNPAMLSVGKIEDFKLTIKPDLEEVRALRDAAFTGTRLAPEMMAETGQSIDISMTYLVQNWNFLQYVLHNGTIDVSPPAVVAAMTDALKSVSFGLISTDTKYAKIGGVKVSKWTLDVPIKGFMKATATMKGAHDNATAHEIWSASDYKGAGSHATAQTTPPLSFKNLKSITWGGSAISNATLGGLKIEIDRKLEDIPDGNETNSTKMGDFVPSDSYLKVAVIIKKGAINPLTTDILSVTKRDLVITITGNEGSPVDQVFTFKNMYIPEEVIELAGKGLSSLEVPFVSGTDLALS